MASGIDADVYRAAARARRDDVELAEALGVPIVAIAAAERARPGWHVYARAAIVLLAVLVIAALAWHRRGDEVALQGPGDYEPPVIPGFVPFVRDTARLEKLPEAQAAVGILVGPRSPFADDLTPLARLSVLRSLSFSGAVNWREGVLAPLAALPRLEVLLLPLGANCPAARLAELRASRSLRFLTLTAPGTTQRAWTADDVKALAELPSLSVLTLSGGSLDAAVVRALSTLPKLDGLALIGVAGCTEDALAELRTVHRLRHLELFDLGPHAEGAADDRAKVGLTPRVAKALQELPLFESLRLRNFGVSAAAIEALPKSLRRIGIRSVSAGADVFAALRRFPDLRCLELAAGGRDTLSRSRSNDAATEAWIERTLSAAPPRDAVWAAQAAALRAPSVRELLYDGPMPDPVREALRGAPLTSLWLSRVIGDRDGDLAAAATVPELQELTLEQCQATRKQLQPLTGLEKLRQVTLRWSGVEPADVRAVLPKVTVLTHGL